jgi:hypothetical protein
MLQDNDREKLLIILPLYFVTQLSTPFVIALTVFWPCRELTLVIKSPKILLISTTTNLSVFKKNKSKADCMAEMSNRVKTKDMTSHKQEREVLTVCVVSRGVSSSLNKEMFECDLDIGDS